jgi:hypothetical protein
MLVLTQLVCGRPKLEEKKKSEEGEKGEDRMRG